MEKYCTKCGKELVKFGDIKGYDGDTGQPIYEMRCPDNPCHQGHDLKRTHIAKWWKPCSPDVHDECKRCNYTEDWYLD